MAFNTYTAKFNNLKFNSIEVVSRYRDQQLRVGEENIII